jgi:catechol 2,3-dioxygenase-like lactoylglutathione lyase family enzyme
MILEHVSLTVADLEAETAFLLCAFPGFLVRGGGATAQDGWTQHWSHVGDDEQYIALYEARPDAGDRPPAHSVHPAANHIGVAVDDAEAVRRRLLDAGYREGFVPAPHAERRRVYIHDPGDFEWEFVEYASDDPARRNAY